MFYTCVQLEALAFPPPATSKWFKWLKRSNSEDGEFLKKRQKDLEVHKSHKNKYQIRVIRNRTQTK